ncbi:MAG: hypothetical protein GY934_04050, partial [Gammaproteobacteria bacterium]|nr:hypothetical protein [Gammaproteobacteria bacterium]
MKTLSRETGGWYQQVNSAEALQRIFLRMFEKVGKPDTLPLKDNRFKVDKSVNEFTLLVFRKEGVKPTKIIPPKGKSFTAKKHPRYVSWHQDLGYDLLTVKKPKQGEWRIQAAVDPDNRVMVVTDLKMRSSELPNVMVEGQQTTLDIFFTDHDKLIVNRQFLELVNLVAQPINGAGEGEARTLLDDGSSDDQKAGDGRFSLKVTPHQNAGTVEWVIRAEGKTFEREQRHLFELLPPVVVTSTDISQDGQSTIKISVIPDITLIDSQSLKVEAQMLGANGELQPLMLLPAGGAWEANIDLTKITGKWGVVADIEAKTLDGELVVLTLDPLYIEGVVAALDASTEAPVPEPEVVDEPEVTSEPDPVEEGLLMQSMIFGAGNLVALVIVGGVLWIIKRRRKDLTDLLNDDEKEEEQDAG